MMTDKQHYSQALAHREGGGDTDDEKSPGPGVTPSRPKGPQTPLSRTTCTNANNIFKLLKRTNLRQYLLSRENSAVMKSRKHVFIASI